MIVVLKLDEVFVFFLFISVSPIIHHLMFVVLSLNIHGCQFLVVSFCPASAIADVDLHGLSFDVQTIDVIRL